MKAQLVLRRGAAVLSLLLLLSPLVLAACGTLETGVERTPTANDAAAATIAALATANARLTTQVALMATAAPTPPPIAAPSPTATATVPAATPAPTAAATAPAATPAPTAARPSATPLATPIHCDDVPIRGFGTVWANHAQVQQGLGCPASYYYCYKGSCSGEQAMVSAIQRFEHGTMIWVNRPTWEGTRWIFVLFEDGTYQRFHDTFQDGDPESDPTIVPPAGFYQPIRGFGKVWREGTGAQVRERLGWATEPEQGGDGAWQDFDRGSMYWIGAVKRIYVIYAYDQDYNEVRTYQEYTDTF